MVRFLGCLAVMLFAILLPQKGSYVSSSAIINVPTQGTGGFTLKILHTNDMHARFEETSAMSSKCSPEAKAAKKCYGGFARIATLVRQARDSGTPTIFLNAGDTYQGSNWFYVHRWRIVSKFLNLLKPDAISLGNHEFDNGPEGLVPFINEATYPIVTANLDLTNEPEMAASKLKKSTILTVNGRKIGIIGYLTPETKYIALVGKVEFYDEVESIQREVMELRAKGVDILIAVGHSGYTTDKRIAKEVKGIDIVVGGHSNTFLYNGTAPDMEIPAGLYPEEIVQKDGTKVYVVQAYAYTKYLGNLIIDFNDNGDVTNITGNPILLDGTVDQATDIIDELEKWRPAVDRIMKKVIGFTKVNLDGSVVSCRRRECSLGNLLADAMVDYNARLYGGGKGWTDAAIAIVESGSIRDSIVQTSDGKVTVGDIMSVVPFNNDLVKLNISGREIRDVLEWGVKTLKWSDLSDLRGAFLQVSGLQIIYDLAQPFGSRVRSVQVRCAYCKIPSYGELDNDAIYTVLMSDYLQDGGDGFSMLKKLKYHTAGVSIDRMMVDYFEKKSPVNTDVEGRIKYLIRTEREETVIAEPGTVLDLRARAIVKNVATPSDSVTVSLAY